MTSTQQRDIFFQQFHLFIEGVEVPFYSIQVNSNVGSMPTANIAVPAQAGLVDIAHFYHPKIHVFYTDTIGKVTEDKLLFSGIIGAVSYSKSMEGGGNKSISFKCFHKYHVINDMLLDYSGWLDENPGGSPAPVEIRGTANSQASLLTVLKGISDTSHNEITIENPKGDVDALPAALEPYRNRLIGMPGVLVNYWQQIKQDTFSPNILPYSDAFVKMYRPLVENGLHMFNRLSGHNVIETVIQSDRLESCPDKSKSAGKVMVPHLTRMFLRSAVQTDLAIQLLGNYLQTSGEVTNLMNMFGKFFQAIEYDMVILNSPAEVGYVDAAVIGEKTYAADWIVKPSVEMYYSPNCNVLYPGMYTYINVQYEEYDVPTRVEFVNTIIGFQPSKFDQAYRGPHSIREALNDVPYGNQGENNLTNTTQKFHYSKVGVFEQARGTKAWKAALPQWLAQFNNSKVGSADSSGEVNEVDAAELADLAAGWELRHPGQDTMNPWSDASGMLPHQRIMIAAVDYYYSRIVAGSRAGSVNCLFNPYIVVGYPIDILEASPTDPSYHAYCTSISHTITPDSCGTQVSFTTATTYTELANYYIPSIHPWLQVKLGLAKNPSIIQNSDAAVIGKQFYKSALGEEVHGMLPEELYQFGEGRAILPSKSITFESLLAAAYREIESKAKIEKRENLTFIPLQQNVYSTSMYQQNDPFLSDRDKLEVGENQFLTYSKYLTD